MRIKYDPQTIKKLRESAGLTQADLASSLGVKRQRVTELETSATGINIKTLERLAAALSVTDANLFFVVENDGCRQ